MLLTAALAVAALQPTGPWSLSHDDRSCAVSRGFGDGGRTTLLLEERLDGRWMLRLAAPSALPGRGEGALSIAIDPPGTVAQTTGSALTPPPHAHGAMEAKFPSPIVDAATGDATLIVGGEAGEIARLSVSGIGAAVRAVKSCRNDILKEAGVDPAAVLELGVSAPDKPSSRENYPPDALRRHIGGQAIVAITVNTAGQVTNCRVVATSGNSSLDEASCKVGRRVRVLGRASDIGPDPVFILPIDWQPF